MGEDRPSGRSLPELVRKSRVIPSQLVDATSLGAQGQGVVALQFGQVVAALGFYAYRCAQ